MAVAAFIALGLRGEAQATPTAFTFTSGDVNVLLTDITSGSPIEGQVGALGSKMFDFGGDSIILDIAGDNVVDIVALKMSIVPDAIAVTGLGSVDVLMGEITGIAPPIFVNPAGAGIWDFAMLADIEALVDFAGSTESVSNQQVVTGTLNLSNPGMLEVRLDGSTMGVFSSPFIDPPDPGSSVRMDANNIKWVGVEAPVPEPGATALYALGLLIVSRARSRRKSAQPA